MGMMARNAEKHSVPAVYKDMTERGWWACCPLPNLVSFYVVLDTTTFWGYIVIIFTSSD